VGEIADMMLDGTLCQQCGGIMEDMSPSDEELANAPKDKQGRPIIIREPPGYPRTCGGCEEEDRPRRRKRGKRG
jgi:hypothetical protein